MLFASPSSIEDTDIIHCNGISGTFNEHNMGIELNQQVFNNIIDNEYSQKNCSSKDYELHNWLQPWTTDKLLTQMPTLEFNIAM